MQNYCVTLHRKLPMNMLDMTFVSGDNVLDEESFAAAAAFWVDSKQGKKGYLEALVKDKVFSVERTDAEVTLFSLKARAKAAAAPKQRRAPKTTMRAPKAKKPPKAPKGPKTPPEPPKEPETTAPDLLPPAPQE